MCQEYCTYICVLCFTNLLTFATISIGNINVIYDWKCRKYFKQFHTIFNELLQAKTVHILDGNNLHANPARERIFLTCWLITIRGAFNLDANNTGFVNNVLDVVSILANNFACYKSHDVVLFNSKLFIKLSKITLNLHFNITNKIFNSLCAPAGEQNMPNSINILSKFT